MSWGSRSAANIPAWSPIYSRERHPVGAVATAEQFPGEGRLSGLAFGATAATALFGGVTPYLAQLLMVRTGSTLIPGTMIAIVAVAVLPVLVTMTETRPPRDLV